MIHNFLYIAELNILYGGLGCTYLNFAFVCNLRCFFRGYMNGGQCFNNECVCVLNML